MLVSRWIVRKRKKKKRRTETGLLDDSDDGEEKLRNEADDSVDNIAGDGNAGGKVGGGSGGGLNGALKHGRDALELRHDVRDQGSLLIGGKGGSGGDGVAYGDVCFGS